MEWCSGLIVILRRARSANPGAWAGGHASLVPWAVAKPTVTAWVGLVDRLTVKFADIAPPVPSVTVTSLIDSAGCVGPPPV